MSRLCIYIKKRNIVSKRLHGALLFSGFGTFLYLACRELENQTQHEQAHAVALLFISKVHETT